MGKVVISENVTLDGVIQDPAGVEGFSHGGWVGRIGGLGREEVVSELKQQIDGEIVVAASFQLWHMLLEHDLVDELRLMIYPVVLGSGKRLFGETRDKKPMRLVSIRMVDDLALLTYETVRDA